jgi:hypothetical protein
VTNTERMVFPSPVFLHTQPLSRGPQPQKTVQSHSLHQQLHHSITSTETTPAPTDRHKCMPSFYFQIPNLNLLKYHYVCVCEA